MLRHRLKFKLFVTFLTTTSLVVFFMLSVMNWSFKSGFTDYLNQSDAEQVGPVAKRLEHFYKLNSDWQYLKDNPSSWREMTRPQDKLAPSSSWHQPPARPGAVLEIGPRLTLFNNNHQAVIGKARSTDGLIITGLKVNNQIVGQLGLTPLLEPGHNRDIAFIENQTSSYYLVVFIALVVSAIVSLLLAHHLLKPIRSLALGTTSLTHGDYDTQIQVGSKDELGQLAEDFNILANTLSANETSRRRWLADISHELRTPLAVLRGEIEAVQDGIRPVNDSTLMSIHTEVGQLGKIVEDLYQLSLSDLGALSYHKKTQDISETILQTSDSFRHRFVQAGISFEVEPINKPLLIPADRDRIGQLLHNLLENSLRYTDRGGHTIINTSLGDRSIFIDLHDSEPAVAQEAMAKIFDPLFRIEPSRNRENGGAGLGLAIVHNIVIAHQGEIEARQSHLGGLWIRITLPRAAK